MDNKEVEQDELLKAFENPETDPTPDIAPVMPGTVNSNVVNQMPVNNASEVSTPNINVSQISTPTMSDEPTPDVNEIPSQNMNVTPMSNVDNTVNQPQVSVAQSPVMSQPVVEENKQQDIDPSISVRKQIEDEIQEDPKFMKKNVTFIIIIFLLISAFILLLPVIETVIGKI